MRGPYFILGRQMFEINQSEALISQNLQSGALNEALFNNHSWLRSEDVPGWLLASFSAPVTNWESLQALPSALQLSARDKDSRAPAPSLPQHSAALTLLRSTGQSYCSRSVSFLTELGSWHLILGSAWDEKGRTEVYLAHDIRQILTEPLFLATPCLGGLGAKPTS